MNLELYKKEILEKNPEALVQVLEMYAAATPNGNDFTILRSFIERNPAFKTELIEFAAERDLVRFSPPDAASEEAIAADAARSAANLARFRSRSNDEPADEVIESLIALADKRGLKKLEFARRLGLSPSLMFYLEKKRLVFSSIPTAIVERVAKTLGTTRMSVENYLDPMDLSNVLFSRAPAPAMYKASSRPEETGPRTFAEAVRDDQTLTSAEKEELLKL